MTKKSKQRVDIITGLDIGSTAVRVAVGQHTVDRDGHASLQIVGAVEVPSEGVQKGIVVSIEETVSSISNALEQVERMTGFPIDHVWVGINGSHIVAQESRGVIAVAKSDGEITDEDIERSVHAARTVASPLNYDVLHVLPKHYSVDGQTGIKDPVGMTGIRLEVHTQMVYGLTSHINNLTKAVYRSGIDIDDVVLSIVASGEAVTTMRQRDIGVGVVNIGGSTTSILVYEGGDIVHTKVLPIGSAHITNDLAIGLKTAIDTAEHIKIHHGTCLFKMFRKKDIVQVTDSYGEVHEFSRQYIAQIIHARMSEILEKVNEELASVQLQGLLPAGIMFTGGGSKIDGLVDLSKDVLGLPSALGFPIDVQGIHEHVVDLSFSTAIGLVVWGARVQDRRTYDKRFPIKGKKIAEQVQKIFRSLMP